MHTNQKFLNKDLIRTIIRRRWSFLKSFVNFLIFLNKSINQIQSINSEGKRDYVVIISPWKLTTAPWFSILVGLCLFKRNNRVHYLVDDLQFEERIDHFFQIHLISFSLRFIKKTGISIDKLSSYICSQSLSIRDVEKINELAFANAIHKHRGEDDSDYFKWLVEESKVKLTKSHSAVKNFIRTFTGKDFILQGGIYASSGLFVSILREENEFFFTYDSGLFGVLMSSFDGIAAQLSDIPISSNILVKNPEEINYAIMIAKEESQKRRDGLNKLSSQYKPYDESVILDDVGILLPLNSPWDSAALNISTVFSSFNNWLIETIKIILENSNSIVTVRQHPDERHWWGWTSTDFKKLIYSEFGNNSRIQFVSCYDEINTYVLLERATAVICYSSTIGIEAVLANKPVCVCSGVYYKNLGFAFVPNSKMDLVLFLENLSTTHYNQDQLNMAYVSYYLGQHCNWLFSNFTPNYEDFVIWTKKSLTNILEDTATQVYLESIESRLPLSYVNHRISYNK